MMEDAEFEALIGEALDSLPEALGKHLNNVEVLVADMPTLAQLQQVGLRPPHTLLGLYEGIPLTRRTTHYGQVLPDRITIFKRPIEAICRTPDQVRVQVRRTVIHEIAHHFGISDERLIELDAY